MIKTKRTILDIVNTKEAEMLLAYYKENQQHIAPWEPLRDSSYYKLPYWLAETEKAHTAYSNGTGYYFVIFDHQRTHIIGVCNFTGVSRGAFQACFLGYSIAKRYEGLGLMTEALTAAIQYIFNNVGLNRIMANYQPNNTKSAALLLRLGFEREGYARRYLNIAGQWRDHVLTAKLNDNV